MGGWVGGFKYLKIVFVLRIFPCSSHLLSLSLSLSLSRMELVMELVLESVVQYVFTVSRGREDCKYACHSFRLVLLYIFFVLNQPIAPSNSLFVLFVIFVHGE